MPSQPQTRKLRIHFNSQTEDKDIIAQALIEVAKAKGAISQLAKSFRFKLKTNAEMIVPDLAMKYLLEDSKMQYGKQASVLYRNIKRWIEYIKADVSKAAVPPFGLTPEQITELRDIVHAHFQEFAAISPDLSLLWSNIGLEVPDWTFMIRVLEDSYFLGKVSNAANLNMDYKQLKKEMTKRPKTRADELALQQSLNNTRRYIRKIADQFSDDLSYVVTSHESRQISAVINEYLAGDLTQTKPTPIGVGQLTPQERDSISTDLYAESERQLQSELYHYFKDDPNNRARDWWRVAVTETRAANNTGRMLKMLEDGYTRMYYLVQPDACQACRDAYIEQDGTPKIFYVNKVLNHALQTAGINVMRKHKGQPNAALHPHCNCVPVEYLEDSPMITPFKKVA